MCSNFSSSQNQLLGQTCSSPHIFPSLTDHRPALPIIRCLRRLMSYIFWPGFRVVSGGRVSLVSVILMATKRNPCKIVSDHKRIGRYI